ncbi:hypothetical protein MarSH_087 [Marseillevirus Shanghai 1]|nr:hypothetical protein MarSH_087 [Marseillevirus Shanghai 1]
MEQDSETFQAAFHRGTTRALTKNMMCITSLQETLSEFKREILVLFRDNSTKVNACLQDIFHQNENSKERTSEFISPLFVFRRRIL